MSFLVNSYILNSSGSMPFGPDPSTLPGLQIWFDAYQITGKSTGDEISTWLDKSGHARDATGVVQNTLKPTYRASDGPNSRPAVRMVRSDNGQGGYFSLPDFLTGLSATEGQGIVILKLDNDPTSSNQSSAPPLGQWGSNTDEYFPVPSSNSPIGHVLVGMGSTTRKDTGDPTTAMTSWFVHEQRTASGAFSARLNWATSGGDFFSTGTNTVGWNSAPYIGHTASNNKFMHALIAEICFFVPILGSTDYATLQTYINTKYGL